MNNLFLTEPHEQYEKSFKNYALTYKKINDEHYFNKYKKALDDFSCYLKYLYKSSNGINLSYGHVGCSTFWLIDKDQVVGVVRIRHQEVDYAGHIGYDISPNYRHKGYGSLILTLALEKAIKIGLAQVIMTCNITNIASKKIIEKNNGVLLGIVFDEEENEHLLKYSISLKTV